VSEGAVCSLGSVLDPAPQILSMSSTTLDGVWSDVRRIAAAIDRSGEAEVVLDALGARMRVVHETLKTARAPRPRVAVIEWLDPLFVAGHWTPELVRRAGGIDVLAEPGAHSVEIDVDRIRAATPDLLLFAPCGFDVERAARESTALLASPAWQWARALGAWALDGNALTSRPGPRLVDAVETMAGIFAPDLVPAPTALYARRL
jgi:iron complex transport system substrate-binding protein